jgi:hypothetical protein
MDVFVVKIMKVCFLGFLFMIGTFLFIFLRTVMPLAEFKTLTALRKSAVE